MVIPVITELKLNANTSVVATGNAFVRNMIAIAGFGSIDYDTFDYYGKHWIIEHVWNSTKPNGRIFIHFHFREEYYNNFGIRVQLHDSWNSLTHSSNSVNDTDFVSAHSSYNPVDPYFPLEFTVINHPEIKGFIWSQSENFGALYLAQPKYIYDGFGYDNINFPWFFIVNTPFDKLVELKLKNPFQDMGERNIETWSQLRYRNFQNDPPTHQIVPSPRILSPSQVGFIGAFSQDICLVASNALPWKKIITVGVKSYLLLQPRSSSAIAIRIS